MMAPCILHHEFVIE